MVSIRQDCPAAAGAWWRTPPPACKPVSPFASEHDHMSRVRVLLTTSCASMASPSKPFLISVAPQAA